MMLVGWNLETCRFHLHSSSLVLKAKQGSCDTKFVNLLWSDEMRKPNSGLSLQCGHSQLLCQCAHKVWNAGQYIICQVHK